MIKLMMDFTVEDFFEKSYAVGINESNFDINIYAIRIAISNLLGLQKVSYLRLSKRLLLKSLFLRVVSNPRIITKIVTRHPNCNFGNYFFCTKGMFLY